jgi:hemerythrin-like domain-containing protein
MLTATYSLVAMSVEHANVRSSLNAFHALVRSTLAPQPALSTGQVDFACQAMERLYHAFGCRKVEAFLIPAVRKATHVADRLLTELDHLRRSAAQAMSWLLDRVRGVAVDTTAAVARFCETAEQFCSALLTRLDREERELFSVARTVLPMDTWFNIAHEMIATEGRSGQPPVAWRLPSRGSVGPQAPKHHADRYPAQLAASQAVAN